MSGSGGWKVVEDKKWGLNSHRNEKYTLEFCFFHENRWSFQLLRTDHRYMKSALSTVPARIQCIHVNKLQKIRTMCTISNLSWHHWSPLSCTDNYLEWRQFSANILGFAKYYLAGIVKVTCHQIVYKKYSLGSCVYLWRWKCHFCTGVLKHFAPN